MMKALLEPMLLYKHQLLYDTYYKSAGFPYQVLESHVFSHAEML